ncbi:hypothetical protein JW935_21635 [candidate division KSB1 bacterium]|nr:hypothetical protein [candidate division KSB1 bacterium]
MFKKMIIFVFVLGFLVSSAEAGKRGTVAMGAKVSTPQLVSVSVTTYPYHLWLVQLEPGVGGGKLNVGLGGNWEYTIGMAFKLSLLQTWGYPIGGIEAGQTYVGGEFELMWKGVNMTVGIYSHNAGENKTRDTILSAGLGIGF